jgi:hypothetical protein
MSEMIERVAKVLCAAEYGDKNATYADMPLWKNYEETARDIIRAMREPTDAMNEAASNADADGFRALDIWDHLIDAALKQ